MIEHPSDLNGFIEFGYALLQDVASDELRSSIHDAASALRDGARVISRQVLYTHAGPIERIAHASIWLDMDAQWDHKVAPNHPMCAVTKHGEPLCRR